MVISVYILACRPYTYWDDEEVDPPANTSSNELLEHLLDYEMIH